jgi:hypothetical protein
MYFTSPLTHSNMLNLVDMPSSSAKLKSGAMAVKVSSSTATVPELLGQLIVPRKVSLIYSLVADQS